MSFEGNISSFLGMSGKGDGTGDNAYSNYDYKTRRINQRNHYIKTGYKAKMGINLDPETGEILDYIPPKNARNPYKMAYKRGFGGSSFKAPDISQVLNIGVIGALAYGGYIVYKKFLSPLGNNAFDDAKDKAAALVGQSYTDTTASAVKANQTTATNLAATGLTVSADHQNLANSLATMINTAGIVQGDKIVAMIKTMGDATFKLVSVAYGTRNLNAYDKSPLHLLTVAAWSDLFSNDKSVGTLKKHLNIVLSSSQLSQISHYLSLVS